MSVIFQITSEQNNSIAKFDILASDKTMWRSFLTALPSPTSSVIVQNWKIEIIKDKSFARITFIGKYEICWQIFKQFQEYIKCCPTTVKSDYPANFNIKKDRYFTIKSKEDYISNIASEEYLNSSSIIDEYNNVSYDFYKNEDNDYHGNYDDYRWVDCGYMNDISNPFEVY